MTTTAAEFTMPSLGADMGEGTLLEWLVKPGDTVHKGDIVAVVDTSKAAVEVETFVEGVVRDLLVEPGTTVAVGTPLASIEQAGTHEPEVPAPRVGSPLARKLASELGVPLSDVQGTGRGGAITREDVTRAVPSRPMKRKAATKDRRPRVTPYARRLAAELGVDVTAVTTDGSPLRAADVKAAAVQTAEQAPPSTGARTRQDEMRATIAARMSRAKREIPHYYLSTTVDLSAALAWMHEHNEAVPVTERIVPAALLLKATALAVAAVPELNGFWVDDGFRQGDGVHLGIAVSLRGGGLVAPALHDADRLTIVELMASMRDLVTRARAGRLRAREMSEPTITVTNLGEQGVESVHGVIYPPQVALVGFGRVVDAVRAVDGLIGVRPVTTLTLAADHRATDGFTGGRLLNAIDEKLQRPKEL